MSPRLARHLRDAVPVIVFFVIVALTWDNVRWYLAPETGPPVMRMTLVSTPLTLEVPAGQDSRNLGETNCRMTRPASIRTAAAGNIER